MKHCEYCGVKLYDDDLMTYVYNKKCCISCADSIDDDIIQYLGGYERKLYKEDNEC